MTLPTTTTDHASPPLADHPHVCTLLPNGRLQTDRLAIATAWGLLGGLEEPDELTSGMTWDTCRDAVAMNEAYDQAATHGQMIGRLLADLLSHTTYEKLMERLEAMDSTDAIAPHVRAVLQETLGEATP